MLVNSNAILLGFQDKIFMSLLISLFLKYIADLTYQKKCRSWLSRIYSISNSKTITHHFHHCHLPLWHYYFQLSYFSSLLIILPFCLYYYRIYIYIFFKDKNILCLYTTHQCPDLCLKHWYLINICWVNSWRLEQFGNNPSSVNSQLSP